MAGFLTIKVKFLKVYPQLSLWSRVKKKPQNLTYVTMCTLDNGRSPASNMLPVTDLVSWCMLHEDTMIIYCPLFIKQIQPVKYKLPYTQWQTLS